MKKTTKILSLVLVVVMTLGLISSALIILANS
jgi:hypothetical protein